MRLKKMARVTTLHVSASMTRPGHDIDVRELERIHRGQGYSRIAVHYVIERSGVVSTGRPSDLPGCLAGRLNSEALQVCLIGGVDDTATPVNNFTPEQLNALRKVVDHHGLPVVFDRFCPIKET